LANEIIFIIIGLILGFLLAKYFFSKIKWKDKKDVLDARWKKEIADLEKKYDVKLEKSNTAIEKLKKEWEVKYEKSTKDWKIKYIKDIEELKKLFKDSEKKIRQKSVSSSRRSLVGKFIERFVPFLSNIQYAPSDMHFLGQPIDYIVFDGLRDDKINKVIFLEVKTGDSKLTKREKSLKEVIIKRKVSWKEVRVDTKSEKTPDKEISEEETSVKDLYDQIDNKLKTVRETASAAYKPGVSDDEEESKEDEEEEYEVECPNCEKLFEIGLDEDDDLRKGVEFTCPHCNKDVTLYEEDTL